MKKRLFILLSLLALSTILASGIFGQTAKPKFVTIKLFYPGSTPTETMTLIDTMENWWRDKSGCLVYKDADAMTNIFCGTYKIKREGGQ
jgi:hypothetical protein